jgi:hypothetical protein
MLWLVVCWVPVLRAARGRDSAVAACKNTKDLRQPRRSVTRPVFGMRRAGCRQPVGRDIRRADSGYSFRRRVSETFAPSERGVVVFMLIVWA